MSMHSFLMGANVVAFQKNYKKYGMTCAWAMQVDYDKIMMLLGSQSVTGKMISKNDIIGVSALSESQEKIANNFGDGHSNERDKFINIDYALDDGAILINNAKTRMKVEVLEVYHLDMIKDDHLVLGLIKESFQDDGNFLSLEDLE